MSQRWLPALGLMFAMSIAGAQPLPAGPPPGGPAAGGPPRLGAEMQRKMAEDFLKEKLPPPLEAVLPAPASDPRDFNGAWIADQFTQLRLETDMYGEPIPLKPAAQRILDRRVKVNYVDQVPYANAAAQCRPAGQTWQFGLIYPFQILQSKDAVVFTFAEMHTVWSIRMNAKHRQVPDQYMGDSVGHWDGDTLVVDTAHYRQPLWIDADGTPASANTHATFRIRRIDYGKPKLEILMTIDDPEMYTRPWSIVRTFVWRPDFAFFQEYNCEPRVSAPDALTRYGYQPEPGDAP